MANSVVERARETVGSPGVKRVLPLISMGLIAAGVVVMLASLVSGGGAPSKAAGPQQASAQDDLRKADQAAQQYFRSKKQTFEGFDVGSAEGLDPSITWNKGGGAIAGEVSIRYVSKAAVLLVSKDASTGKTYCLVHSSKGIKLGVGDVSKPADCNGGWQ